MKLNYLQRLWALIWVHIRCNWRRLRTVSFKDLSSPKNYKTGEVFAKPETPADCDVENHGQCCCVFWTSDALHFHLQVNLSSLIDLNEIFPVDSILGMNLFGCKFCDPETRICDRKNFDSLLWATVTVFQVISWRK